MKFFRIKAKSTNDKVKKMKPEDIEKQDFENFYNKIKNINSISENANVEQKGEISNQSDKPLKSKIELDGYVELVNEYKSLIKGLYDRRVKNNTNSELKNSIFKNHVIVDDFKGYSLVDLRKIQYWLSRVKKISGGWFSVWDDNAKNCCKKLTELLEEYLSNLNKNKISTTKLLSLKEPKNLSSASNINTIKSITTMDIGPKFQNETPLYISNLQGYLSELSDSLKIREKEIETESSLKSSSTEISSKISGNVSNESIAIFDIARNFSNYFLKLLEDEEIALHEADLWKTIRKNKSKLEILTKDKINNIINLLIWQKAADEILAQLQDLGTVKVNPKLLTKIENLVKQQGEMESKKGNPGSNPVKDEKRFKHLFIKCCTATEKAALKLYNSETLCEKSKWIRKCLLPSLVNFIEALMHLNSFIRCAYFNRIGKKSGLYEQLRNNIDTLSLPSTTLTVKGVVDLISDLNRTTDIIKKACDWLPNLCNIKPSLKSSWDNTVHFHVKCLNKISMTVYQKIKENKEYFSTIAESDLVKFLRELLSDKSDKSYMQMSVLKSNFDVNKFSNKE